MNWPRLAYKHLVYLPVVTAKAGRIGPRIRYLERSQSADLDSLRAMQLDRLVRLVDHARRNTGRYRELPPIGELPDLESLPLLAKEDLQQTPDQCRSRPGERRLIRKTTGGSTGEPVTIWKTRSAWLWELAATWRGYHWAGVGMGDAQARFWGVPFSSSARRTARLTDLVCRRYRLSAFGFDDDCMARYVRELQRFKPGYFYGYVSMIAEFADFLVRRGIPWRPDLKCIITTSEVLTEPVRRRIEDVFDVKVYNEYGCGELGTIAHECQAGRLHVSAENMIVEILDGDRVCGADEVGEIVVTELNNTAMPLIRYRLGDFGALSSEPCPCGKTLPVLSGVHGRAYDTVWNQNGERFHGELVMYIFEEIKRQRRGIKQFQVIQERIDRFRVRIVPDESYDTEIEELIRRRLQEYFGAECSIFIELVSRIDRSRSGKMRVVIGLDSVDSHQ